MTTHMGKKWPPSQTIKINSRWAVVLNVKSKIMQHIEDNIGN